MSSKKKILFLINPVSGVSKKLPLAQIITDAIDKNLFDTEIKFTTHPGHAAECARQAVQEKTDIVVAVGGDGTINEIAGALLFTETALAIIPRGSGNGLARHLKIPLQLNSAIQKINTGKPERMDAIRINDFISVNVSGIGFDAKVAHLFANSKMRGFLNYAKHTIAEFGSFKEFEVSFTADNKNFSTKAFIVAIANSSQFGNNASVAPDASVTDGLIDIAVIRKIPARHLLPVFYKLFNRKIASSRFVKMYRCKKMVLNSVAEIPLHVDGEPRGFVKNVKAEVLPLALTIWR